MSKRNDEIEKLFNLPPSDATRVSVPDPTTRSPQLPEDFQLPDAKIRSTEPGLLRDVYNYLLSLGDKSAEFFNVPSIRAFLPGSSNIEKTLDFTESEVEAGPGNIFDPTPLFGAAKALTILNVPKLNPSKFTMKSLKKLTGLEFSEGKYGVKLKQLVGGTPDANNYFVLSPGYKEESLYLTHADYVNGNMTDHEFSTIDEAVDYINKVQGKSSNVASAGASAGASSTAPYTHKGTLTTIKFSGNTASQANEYKYGKYNILEYNNFVNVYNENFSSLYQFPNMDSALKALDDLQAELDNMSYVPKFSIKYDQGDFAKAFPGVDVDAYNYGGYYIAKNNKTNEIAVFTKNNKGGFSIEKTHSSMEEALKYVDTQFSKTSLSKSVPSTTSYGNKTNLTVKNQFQKDILDTLDSNTSVQFNVDDSIQINTPKANLYVYKNLNGTYDLFDEHKYIGNSATLEQIKYSINSIINNPESKEFINELSAITGQTWTIGGNAIKDSIVNPDGVSVYLSPLTGKFNLYDSKTGKIHGFNNKDDLFGFIKNNPGTTKVSPSIASTTGPTYTKPTPTTFFQKYVTDILDSKTQVNYLGPKEIEIITPNETFFVKEEAGGTYSLTDKSALSSKYKTMSDLLYAINFKAGNPQTVDFINELSNITGQTWTPTSAVHDSLENPNGILVYLSNITGQFFVDNPQKGITAGPFKNKEELFDWVSKNSNLFKGPPTTTPTQSISKSTPKFHQAPLGRVNDINIPADDFINNPIQGGPKGSNAGGWYLTKSGDKVYVKTNSGGDGHSAAEGLANSIYKAFSQGGTLPRTGLTDIRGTVNHVSYKLSDDYELLRTRGETDDQVLAKISQHAADEFFNNAAIDILLANWDVVSYNWTNILYSPVADQIARIDNGGSLIYRATGGRKDITTIAEDFKWFSQGYPNKTPTYVKLLHKAGHKDLIDILPRISEQVSNFPLSWKHFVDRLNLNIDKATKDEFVDFLNRRTKEFRDLLPDLEDQYVQRLAENLNNVKGPNYVPMNAPPWQQLLKVGDQHLSSDELAFLKEIKREYRNKFPEFRVFDETVKDWVGSSRNMRGDMAKLLNIQTSKYKPSGRYKDAARVIIQSIARESPTAPPLYRGRRLEKSEYNLVENLKPGDTYEILPGSFTDDRHTGMYWAANILIEVEPGSKALDIRNIYNKGESEWITGGKYEVISTTKEQINAYKNALVVKVRQIGTFDVP